MAGRGGRGAALLKALEEPRRRPGAASNDETNSGAPAPQVSSRPLLPKGRGSYLLQAIPKAPDPTPAPQEPLPTTQIKPRPTGRGAALLQMVGPSPPRPVRQVKPLSPPPKELAPAMKQLSLEEPSDEPVKICREKGKSGANVKVSANYIRLISKNTHWYQYSVMYTPNVDSKGMRFKLLYMHEDVIGPARVFDGSILYLPHELPSKVTTFFSVNPYTEQSVNVKVTMSNKISIDSPRCIQMYNILFKRIMNILKYVQIGRSASYDKSGTISIPQHKLKIWPGYVTTVQQYEGGVLLMCDVSHKVLRDQTAYDLIREIYADNRIPASEKRNTIIKALVGQSVITKYNNKNYRIDDIDFDSSPKMCFERREGPISFIEYYRSHYAINIRDPDQPMLISRPKKRDNNGEKVETLLCLVPELSHMTGLTDDMRANFRVMKDIALHTRVTPQNRVIAMRNFIQNIHKSEQASAQLAMWGLKLDMDIVKLEGRQFAPEKIILGDNFVGSAGPKADWTRDATNRSVVLPVDLKNWVLVFASKDRNKAQGYLNTYQKVAPQLGIQISPPNMIQLSDDRIESYIHNIRDSINAQVQLVVVILPTKREDKYNSIKKLLCSEKACPSQVIIAKTISDERKLRSVVQKISLQINAKLGGELWRLSIPLSNSMYVGIDVYHDGAKKRGRSVAGMVASLNKSGTRYYSRIATQNPGEELIDGLKVCFTAALNQYHRVNGRLPDKVIVFRDGVGDNMLEVILEHEVKQLESCFSGFEEYRNSPPGLCFIVVQKRISTRIFAQRGPAVENPAPGTVLDHTLCKNKWLDFFLVSQHVTQGTVTPTHYIVIHDSTGLKPDNLQQLSYKMCHLYYNWSGTVRVPAPCQYAHKLAYLIGENVRRDPAEALADKLYYL